MQAMLGIEKRQEQTSIGIINPNNPIKSQEELDKLGIKDSKLKEVLSARLQKTIAKEDDDDFSSFVNIECLKALERIGQNNLKPERAEIIRGDLLVHLRAKCSNWAAYEVVIALRMGALGEFGEVARHLTSQVMIQWLRAYESQVRTPATKELKKALSKASKAEESKLPKQNKGMTTEQKKEAILDAFEAFKKGQVMAGSFIYGLCMDLKLLDLPKESRWEYIRKAGDEIILEAKAAMTNPITKMAAKVKIEEVKRVEIGKPATIAMAVKNRAQLIAVREYFAECVEIDMSPLDLIQ